MEQSAAPVDPIDLARALLNNADELLADAELLLENDRTPRAGALAVMATEELSKLHLCLAAVTGEADVPSARSREWTDHRDKLQTAKAFQLGFIDADPSLDMDEARLAVEGLLSLKMACLYVDHGNGKVRRPSDLDVDAYGLVKRGWAQSVLLHGIFDQITPEVLEGIRLHHEAMNQIAEALIDRERPELSIRRLRAVVSATANGDTAAVEAALVEGLHLAEIENAKNVQQP